MQTVVENMEEEEVRFLRTYLWELRLRLGQEEMSAGNTAKVTDSEFPRPGVGQSDVTKQ